MRLSLSILLLLFTHCVFGQDSLNSKNSEKWRNLYIPKTLLRTGIGYQKSLYGEIGITRRKYQGQDLFVLGNAYYTALEYTPPVFNVKRGIYGIKAGWELTTQPLLLAVEAKYQLDFSDKSDYVITPKIGVGDGNISGSTVSSLFICYGYNISFKNSPFESATHQFSLITNPINLSQLLNNKNYNKKLYK